MTDADGRIFGLCGNSELDFPKVPDVIISQTTEKSRRIDDSSPYIIAKDVFKLESAISMLRGIRNRKLHEATKEIRQALELIVIETEKQND